MDDHSRLAYSEPLADERSETAAAFWTRAQALFASMGIMVARVLTDNGACYSTAPGSGNGPMPAPTPLGANEPRP